MGTLYETDIVAWANEQAALLRSGHFFDIDAANIAEEIEDVGKSEHRELASRMVVLLAHLLKWQFDPKRRGNSWRTTIRVQRKAIARALRKAPSLKHAWDDEEWLDIVWNEAAALAQSQAGTDLGLPETWAWSMDQVFDPEFFPD